MTKYVVGIIIFPFSVLSQNRREDLSLWTWLQFEKRLGNGQYAQFQYQTRFNENISRFNRSNIYFIYGVNFLSHWQLEGIYQLNTNYEADQHTFFAGLTYKQKFSSRISLFYRTGFQTIRNYFTGDIRGDKPYAESRNRIRVKYKINNLFSTAISAEPYLKFSYDHPAYLSRIRYVSQFNYRFNKYQTFSFFYMIEPDVICYSQPQTDYILGITYYFIFPNKAKGFKKLFKPKELSKDSGEEDEMLRDTYN